MGLLYVLSVPKLVTDYGLAKYLPEPQLATIGLLKSTPAVVKTFSSSSLLFMVFVCGSSISVNGRLTVCGM